MRNVEFRLRIARETSTQAWKTGKEFPLTIASSSTPPSLLVSHIYVLIHICILVNIHTFMYVFVYICIHTQEEVQPDTLECFMYSSNHSCFRLSGVQKLSRRKKATTAFCIGLHLGLVIVLDSDDFVTFSFAFLPLLCSGTKLCPTLQPHGLQHTRLPYPYLLSLLKFRFIESVMLCNHLILCCPFLFSLSIFPSFRVFAVGQFFSSGGQSIRVSSSASVPPMNIQD